MKKKILLSLILILMLTLFGCGNDNQPADTSTQTQGVNEIYIYYPEGNKIVLSDNSYQLKQPDSIVASIEEVMSATVEAFGGKIESYSYMIDEDNDLSLDIVVAGDTTRDKNLLIMAAVTDTLFQIEELSSIDITLINQNGEDLDSKLIQRDTFYYYGNDEKSETKRVTFYKATGEGDTLEALTGYVTLEDDVSIVENIIVQLEDINAIPTGTKANTVSINSGVCYLDLSQEFEGTVEGVKSDVVIYSVVNSITSLSYINKVYITIEGQIVESYRGTEDLRAPLSFNKDIIK